MITLTIRQLVDDAIRKYGHDRADARRRFDQLVRDLEHVDETTIDRLHIDPVDAADLVDAYARTYVHQ